MPPEQNGAKTIQQTQNANDLDDCTQMLSQSIAEVRSCKVLAEDRLKQVIKRDELAALDQKLIDRLYKIIEVSDKLIQRLEKQCTTTTWFFVIKHKQC